MFTHLHCHSFFSFSAGTIPARELPGLAVKAGMTALALTDTNNMSGAIEFYFAAKNAGIKPILGVELKTRHERAVLLARNNAGYKEICEALTRILVAIPQIKPKLTLEDVKDEPDRTELAEDYSPLAPHLQGLSENVYVLSSSPHVLSELQNKPNVFIELIPAERKQWNILRDIYRASKLPVVATNNVFLRDAREFELHELMRAIGTNTTFKNTPSYEMAAPSQWFMSEAEFRKTIGNIGEEAFGNIERIAEECTVAFDNSYNKFARYSCDDPYALLNTLSEAGLARRYSSPTSEHITRFESELNMIQRQGAVSYFLAVHDMIEFARSKNFPYLGRGSGANSLIAYCLGISNVDPVANNLRFERFLNPERESAPDFDIDFSWRDRYEVINYMIDKYGRENAAMLCTIQCYRGRGGIREVGKALGYSDAEINERITHLSTATHTQDVRAINSEGLPDVHDWLAWAKRLQGFPRHLSVHAGGIVIGDKALTHYTPLQQAPIGVPITHIDMFAAEDIKLIKLDILATRGLGAYWDTMRIVAERTGERPPVEDERVAFADEPTQEIIRTGKTKGCFYIESPAMIGLLRKLQTDTFENLTAASSVIRPGVAQSGMMDEFIHRRHLARVAMLHNVSHHIVGSEAESMPRRRNPATSKPIPQLVKLLPETYGVMVYQEDVLTVVHEFAGLSYGEADIFRRSMSGKLRSHERMSKMEGRFIEGCLSRGVDLALAKEVWRQVSSFGGYSFCKAHSASYAVLSFQEAWLKVHHPTEFLCSVLNNFGGFYGHQEYINEAKALGVTVRLPDVNYSSQLHTVESDGVIRLGFVAFKDLSQQSIDNLLANRESGGRYTSIEDFALRSGVTPEDGNLLIKLGACQSIEPGRSIAAMKFGLLVRERIGKTRQYGLEYPIELSAYNFSHLQEPDPLTIFKREREYFGYAVTNHPSDFLRIYEEGSVRAADIKQYANKTVCVVGFHSATKPVTTRTGKSMLMLNISDHTGMMDIVVWNEKYLRYYSELSTGRAWRITGKVVTSFGVPTIEAKTVEKLEFVVGQTLV